MSFRKLSSLILAAAMALFAISCDKDDDTTTSPSLDGKLTFHTPEYINQYQRLTFTPKGITHPDGEFIGYSWKVSPGMEKSDTTRLQNGLSPDGKESDGSFSYPFTDSLGTYTVSCYGFAKGYTSSYASAYVTVVKGGLDGSITGSGISANDPSIKSDDITYHYASINGLDWFRRNLADPAYGTPFANAEAMSDVFGRYYSYEEAMTACPEGWRLPTDAEWSAMAASMKSQTISGPHSAVPSVAADLMCNASFNSTEMWEYWPAVGEITNKSKLSVIPAGYANLGEMDKEGGYPTASFFGVYDYAVFWTADKVESEEGMAYYRYIIGDQPELQIGKGDVKTLGASVRCVRETK
jgi:uncharacterized protein (TIGR02145 family)